MTVFGMTLMLAACDSKEPLESGDTGTDNLDTDTGTGDVEIAPIDNIHQVVAGKTFIWDIQDKNWSEPRGSGAEFGQAVPNIMLQITNANEDGTMTFFTGTADVNGIQSDCTTTVDIQAAVGANPAFTTTPINFLTYGENLSDEAPVHQVQATMYGMTMGGSFVVKDGVVGIRKGFLEMMIDFRETVKLFHLRPNATPESICEEAPDFNAHCEACPNDPSSVTCLKLKAELVSIDEAVGKSVVPKTSACFK